MANLIPKICGKNEIIVPESDCSECDALETRVEVLEGRADSLENRATALEGCCTDVQAILATKLTKENIAAGENVSVTYDAAGNVIISSTGGGGGGGDVTKANILAAMGYQELEVQMTATDGTQHKWRIMGCNADSPVPPSPTGDVTKANILAAMGYSEFSMEMTDEDGVAGMWNIIGVQIA